jgi:molecular chaperone GrpE
MIFKKKKAMHDNLKNNTNQENNNADNLSEQTQNDETLSTGTSNNTANAVVEINEEKIELLQMELDEQKDKYVRLAAEYDNFRRRSRKEHYDLEQSAGKEVITSLLVVLDDIDRASKQMETSDDIKVIKEGVTLVFNKMRAIMQKKGLRLMETNKEEFNPDLHEAITEIPVTSEEMQGKIIDVIEPGYYLNDKLIRCAKVIIGKVNEASTL